MLNEQKYDIVEAKNKETGSLIPEHEPVFLLRAYDSCAFDALLAYLYACNKAGCSKSHLQKIIGVMGNFNSYGLQKVPD